MIISSASCTQVVKERFFRKPMVQSSGHPSGAQARLQEALHHLQTGQNSTAGEILKELSSPEGDTSHVGPASEFYLGVIKLFEMGDVHEMGDCKSYFEAYIEKYPNQPYQTNAARIVRLLEKHIERARKDGQRVAELNRVVDELNQAVGKQAKEIQTLKYQMQKLEEIQLETERKRQSFELEGPE
jgi:uncharacterized coiled-coil protein SlyX